MGRDDLPYNWLTWISRKLPASLTIGQQGGPEVISAAKPAELR